MTETWIWAQSYNDRLFKEKATADEFVEMVRGKFTDVMLTSRADDNGRVWFNSELTAMRPERIDGKPGGVYLLDRLHEAGIKAHAWIYTGFWSSWTRAHVPPPEAWNMRAHPDYSDSWVNFSIEGMRQYIADHVADIVNSNDLDGVHLDYLRLRGENLDCPFVTDDHVTDVARRIRAGIGDKVLSAAFSGRGAEMAERQRRGVWTWLTEPGLFDRLQMMSYITRTLEFKLEWLNSLPNNDRVLPGVATFSRDADGIALPSFDTFADHTTWWYDHDRMSLAYFDSWTFRQPMAAWLPDLGTMPDPEPEPEPEPDPEPTWMPNWQRIASLERQAAVLYRALADLCEETASEYDEPGG